jgi:hypothetical protein
MEPASYTYKVIHKKDDIETVYLVSATSERDAETQVLDSLYDRSHPITYTPEELERDAFGLKQHSMTHGGTWTNYALCKQNDCSCNATLWAPDIYKLYSLNIKTGEMT